MFVFSSTAQIELEYSMRSAKSDTIFDFYVGVGYTDSVYNSEIKIYGSYERDNGTFYYQYLTYIQNDSFKLLHHTDTENNIDITSVSVYHKFVIKKFNIFLGVDYTIQNKQFEYMTDSLLVGGYMRMKYEFISVEAAYNGDFYKLIYDVHPKFNINDNFNIGILFKGTMIESVDKFKWFTGITLGYKL